MGIKFVRESGKFVGRRPVPFPAPLPSGGTRAPFSVLVQATEKVSKGRGKSYDL